MAPPSTASGVAVSGAAVSEVAASEVAASEVAVSGAAVSEVAISGVAASEVAISGVAASQVAASGVAAETSLSFSVTEVGGLAAPPGPAPAPGPWSTDRSPAVTVAGPADRSTADGDASSVPSPGGSASGEGVCARESGSAPPGPASPDVSAVTASSGPAFRPRARTTTSPATTRTTTTASSTHIQPMTGPPSAGCSPALFLGSARAWYRYHGSCVPVSRSRARVPVPDHGARDGARNGNAMTAHSPERTTPERDELDPKGLATGVTAYVIWGLFPAFWTLLDPAAPVEVLAHRIVWTAVLMSVVLTVLRGWSDLRRLDLRGWCATAAAAVFIAVSWGMFIWGVSVGRVVEAALGYYMTPLVGVLLGVVMLRERLRPMQWVALALAVVAVGVIAFGNGEVPWLSMVLAGSFGIYGLFKATVRLPAATSLTAEGLVLLVPATIYLLVLESAGSGTFVSLGP
ncbi:Protein rarD [Pseudonocardia sp. Ae168_Ps1]|nr:Protein rarD [Pseudonocardia sp. Ae168_Ps1]OLL85662.1 Protein rarD [Pseudonocardia sp. Ae263_Ps1]OLL94308.1 Protein rarD [Pseudonocardia sp. Ae356_Ps1]